MRRSWIGLILMTAMTGCSGAISNNSPTTPVVDGEEFAVESALSAVTAEATATEGGSIAGGTGCSYSSRTSCVSNADAITFRCNADGSSVIMRGTWSETFSGTGVTSCDVPIADGETIARTTTDLTTTLTYNKVLGLSIKTDTTTATAYDGTTTVTGGISTLGGTTTLPDGTTVTLLRTFTLGVHKTGIYRGAILFDHLVTTAGAGTALTMTGADHGSRVLSGQVIVYHDNLPHYTATTMFTSASWTDSSCCYPTTGSAVASIDYGGGVTGGFKLQFTPSCGTGIFTNTATGISKTIVLTSCN